MDSPRGLLVKLLSHLSLVDGVVGLWVGEVPHELMKEISNAITRYTPLCYNDQEALEDEAFCSRCSYAKTCKAKAGCALGS